MALEKKIELRNGAELILVYGFEANEDNKPSAHIDYIYFLKRNADGTHQRIDVTFLIDGIDDEFIRNQNEIINEQHD